MAFPRPVSGSGLNQLTGDVTAGPGSGSQVATLAAVTTAQTVGDATHYPVITTDTKGRVTGAVATAVPSGALSYIESYITVDNTSGAANENITSISLAAGTWLIEGVATILNSATVQWIQLLLSPTSASETSAYTVARGYAIASQYLALSVQKIVVLAAVTTVYLVGSALNSYTVVADPGATGAVASGISAIKIA